MTFPSGFQKGRFSKKKLQFPGGTRLEQSQGITEVVGAFLLVHFTVFTQKLQIPRVSSLARLRESPRARCGRGRPGRRGAGSERAVWRLQTSAPFKAESFPGGRASSARPFRTPFFADRRLLVG